MEMTFIAPDIECDGCANSIKKALGQSPGVETVDVNIERKSVVVGFDAERTNGVKLAETLNDIGFPVARESDTRA
jgi:copper chaperone CopZ